MGRYRTERVNINKLLTSKTILIFLSAIIIVMAPMQSVDVANAQEQAKIVPVFLAPITASGDNVYVTWWDNKTGTREVFFRASTNNGDTFGNTIMLNSTNSGAS
jgi:hypothetical protein